METLDDVSCRSCSLKATAKRLQEEINTAVSEDEEMEKLNRDLHLIRDRLSSRRIEDPIDSSIKLSRVVSKKSTKQVMFAKPPKCLCLHISRSAFHTSGAVYKNTCQVTFPESLDLTPYCTNSHLKVNPDMPISGPQESTSNTIDQQRKYQYRLMSTIVHYGSHNFGHFIAYKRRLERCGCRQCLSTSSTKPASEPCQNDWYRVSDEKVDTCSIQDVLKANPYMLIYELVEEQPQHQPPPELSPKLAKSFTSSSGKSVPTFKKTPLHSHITNSTMHRISMNKTVSDTIQATTMNGIKLPPSAGLQSSTELIK